MIATRLAAVFVCALFIMSCGDADGRDRGPIRTDPGNDTGDESDTGDGVDMGGTTDTNDPADMGGDPPDMADSGMDMGEPPDAGGLTDVPTGMTCGYTDITPFPSTCDFVTLAGCAEPNEACLVTVTVSGPTTTLSAICRDTAGHILQEGETCGQPGEDCAAGLICVSFYNECRRVCDAATGFGCEPDNACRRPDIDWGAVGFCDIRCPN